MEEETPETAPPKKGPRAKKRPSDFEIVRTILQRTTERKLPYVLRNMGETDDVLLLCSEKEDGFFYGSSSLAIGLIQFDDPELQTAVTGVLEKLHGFKSDHQLVINLRDQISDLVKTKGETLSEEPTVTPQGTAWFTKTDIRGQERTVYYAQAVDSLYHFEVVSYWRKLYTPLLTTEDPSNLYYPYDHTDPETYSVLTLPCQDQPDHPICKLYPHGFRTYVTKGFDVLMTKQFENIPYPVERAEMIAFCPDGAACQLAHRLIGQGWRMVVLRPNAFLFPALSVPLTSTGTHVL